jgi:transposase
MKFVAPLSETEQTSLQSMSEYHPSRRVRMRAKAIILSHQGFTVQEIAFISQVARQTVSLWFDSWDRHGLAGLYDNPRSGHPGALSDEDIEYIMKLNAQEPRSTRIVGAALEADLGKKVSVATIKRIIK